MMSIHEDLLIFKIFMNCDNVPEANVLIPQSQKYPRGASVQIVWYSL